MKQYTVTGMTCAACSARVEKAVAKVSGVTACNVSLLTNSMRVEGTAASEEIVEAVRAAGYDAYEEGAGTFEKEVPKPDNQKSGVRLIASVAVTVLLMYVSMGHMMWKWPLPAFFDHNHIAVGLLQLMLSSVVLVINRGFFVRGFTALWHRSPNMDTLVAMGSGVSYAYSVYVLFAMTKVQAAGDAQALMEYMHELYFETAAMILTLISVGKYLEARAKGRTTDALKDLMKLAPQTANIEADGVLRTVDVSLVKKGDVYVVRPGEKIPVDGIVLEGYSAVNESALTGESIPADKSPGDYVYAATINRSGFLRCEAVKVKEDTAISEIIRLVGDAAATKAPIARIADRVSGVFVPVVIGIALLTIAGWLLAGESVGYALARGISVLVISCPCALGLATPVAIMVGNGVGARHGILFKTAASLEAAGKVGIVALDKTGTITRGEPKVKSFHTANGFDCEKLLAYAYALEYRSEHPLAKAVVKRAKEEGTALMEVTDGSVSEGRGLAGTVEGHRVYGGNIGYIEQYAPIPDEAKEYALGLSKGGGIALYFALDGQLMGIIGVADVIKEDSPRAVRELHDMGIRVVMLTGDNRHSAEAVAGEVGIESVIGEVLPARKEQVVRELKREGRVAMVGDGINDAPALKSADIGIAIKSGTDIAIDAADVVLMRSRLSDVSSAIRLSRMTLKNIKENLFWAFFYNAIGIPLAAGLFIPLFGWELNPMYGAAAMSLSSFCVVANALRINLFKVKNENENIEIQEVQSTGKAEKEMRKTITIEGMMCGHCEARVKKALEAVDGVSAAIVSHKEGTAVVTLDKEVDDSVLIKAVEAQDYKVIGPVTQ